MDFQKNNIIFGKNDTTRNYEITDNIFKELEKFDLKKHPYIKGFKNDEDYADFFFENQDEIIEYTDNLVNTVYIWYSVFNYGLSQQEFYRGLYYKGNTTHTNSKVFSLIAKFIVNDIITILLNKDFRNKY